jgi:benzodiazapine receptor
MLVLLGTLIITYLRLGTGRSTVSKAETWTVRVPISIYLGWITVATIANVTELLYFLKWDGFGVAAEVWMYIILVAVFVIATLMNFSRRDIAYTMVILWALAGISVKHADVPAIAIPTWITFGLVAMTLILAFILPDKTSSLQPVE